MYKQIVDKNNNQASILVIDEIPPYDREEYDLFDDKDFKKYTADVERIIRSSFEYRKLINYLREYMDMNKCSFFENISNANTTKIKIHIHHHPLTLYDIVMTVFSKRSFYGESLEVEMVAKEAMYVHYFLMVGLIPLSETVHTLVHAQALFIPLDRVMGNWEEFLDTYGEFVPIETMDKIERYKQETVNFIDSKNRELLKQEPIYIQLPDNGITDDSGSYKLPGIDTIIHAMNDRLEELKNQKYQIEQRDIIEYTKYDSNSIFEDEEKSMPIIFKDNNEDNNSNSMNKDNQRFIPIYFRD